MAIIKKKEAVRVYGQAVELDGLKTQKEVLDELLKNKEIRKRFQGHSLKTAAALFVKSCRLKAKMSQGELGEAIGVSQGRIAQIENPKSKESMSMEQLDEVAEACGGSIRATFELV